MDRKMVDELEESLFGTDLFGETKPANDGGKLKEKFILPPFSVLNAREGWWQERKRAWLGLGIESELGRDDNALGFSNACKVGYKEKPQTELSGTSVFDPVLCELSYRWFCPPDGVVLDPFAGGSVRGIVASKLGRKYYGVELRPEQVKANRDQGLELCPTNGPIWREGDSRDIENICGDIQANFIFSCPPYADLEVYSDDPRDISTLDYNEFITAYRKIIECTVNLLDDNSFACFVIGDIRNKKGNYYGFPAHTIKAFQDAGMELYNEAALVTSVGSLPIRVTRQFDVGRKLGKTHQNVLVFVKGSGKEATAKINE